jgi:DMSO/TMAO reductase YedYZ molybdopterin-dependent catalytic subunit
MFARCRFAAIILLVLCGISSRAAAEPTTQPSTQPGDAVLLHVGGKVPHPLNLSLDQLVDLQHITETVADRKGNSLSYRGIPLEIILKLAGLKFGGMSTARAAAGMCLIAKGADGYKAVFSLAELDGQFRKSLVILADRENGKPFDSASGPLKIVAPDDAIHARWVHRVVSITVAEP